MFLMIVIVNEFKQVKVIFFEEKEKFVKVGVMVFDDIEVGMMVEILFIVVIVDQFVIEVDFFSIGINDLI